MSERIQRSIPAQRSGVLGLVSEAGVLAGENGVEHDAHDGGDGKGSQGDGNTAD